MCTCLQYSNGIDYRLIAANTLEWLRCFPSSIPILRHHIIICIMPCHAMPCLGQLSPLSYLLSPLSSPLSPLLISHLSSLFSLFSSLLFPPSSLFSPLSSDTKRSGPASAAPYQLIRVRTENALTGQFVLHPTVRVLHEQHSSNIAFDYATALNLICITSHCSIVLYKRSR